MFRIQDIRPAERGRLPKGYSGTYQILEDETPLYIGHVARYLMKPSEFTGVEEGSGHPFRLRPSRRVMPMIWVVADMDSGKEIGRLKRKVFGKTAWRIFDGNAHEIGRILGIYRPMGFVFRFFDAIFGSQPDSYQVVSNGSLIAKVQREERPKSEEKPKRGFAGLVRKFLVDKDWVIREQNGAKRRIDHRLLISGVLLLERVSRDVSD